MPESAISHIACHECGGTYDLDASTYPCPECGGILDPQYDLDAISIGPEDIEARHGSMWRYRELLPVRDGDAVTTMGEGNTPLVECPTMADRLGVDRLYLKDEGQNPTNTFKDRGLSAAISVERERGIDTVALPSAGNAGQSASAYAARAGMGCHVFLNQQTGTVQRDLVQTHGATLHLVDGQIPTAGAACADAVVANGWQPIGSFVTPFRHDGKKTMGFEIFEGLDWQSPDEIVYPTGGGVGLIGIWKAYQELTTLGWIEDRAPSLVVAQAAGVAPVVKAIEEGWDRHEPWTSPHSVAKGLEIPDPGASPWILDVVADSDGDGVAVTDSDAIDAAIDMARADGVEMCVPSAVALAGAIQRAADGVYDGDETIVIVNTGGGVKSAARLGANLDPDQ